MVPGQKLGFTLALLIPSEVIMRTIKTSFSILMAALLLFPATAMGLDHKEFDRILNLGMEDLTREAKVVLDRRYADEDWESYRFPRYVFTSDAVETGYRIAVKEPQLLASVPCYCFCEAMGHQNLLQCFVKKGKRLRFDDHAVGCNICFGQAMLALLWQEMGADEEEIRQGMERKFAALLRGE
jgi:hypothetical protein